MGAESGQLPAGPDSRQHQDDPSSDHGGPGSLRWIFVGYFGFRA